MFSSFFNRKTILWAILGVLIFSAFYCYRLWQPARQVALHQRHLLDALENRNWERVSGFIADDFTDSHGHDKAWAVREGGQVLRHFFALTIHDEDTVITLGPPSEGALHGSAEVSSRLRIEGSGTAIASEVQSVVNRQRTPFLFRWERRSGKPWDWQLVHAAHPVLERSASPF